MGIIPEIVFNIATVERRKVAFMEILGTLASQTVKCDSINIALGYKEFDKDAYSFLRQNFRKVKIKFKGGVLPCENKLFRLDKIPDDSYVLTFDDDIIYPQDYTKKMIAGIEKYNRKSVVGFHGIKFDKFPVKQYKAQKTMYQYFQTVNEDIPVDVIGTGCMGFYNGLVRDKMITFDKINTNSNCLDGSFGHWCRENKVPMTVLAHSNDWMKIYPESQDSSSLWIKSSRERYKTKLSFLER